MPGFVNRAIRFIRQLRAGNSEGKESLPHTHYNRNDHSVSSPSWSRSSSRIFKVYIIASMTLLWTGYTLTVKLTRSTKPPEEMYLSTTVVLLTEVIKILISLVMLFKEAGYRFTVLRNMIMKFYIGKPAELFKTSVPSFAYALQNNLDFVALSNLDPGVYQITTQLKIVSTAIFMIAFLGRRFSRTRWFAICLLFVGVSFVQLDTILAGKKSVPGEKGSSSSSHHENYLLGLIAVLCTCVTSGFAGVYFEKMLKDGGSTPFWIRNLQLCSSGVVSAAIGMLLVESEDVFERGFFFGYDKLVYAVIGLLSVGGIYISLVVKYLDNLYKSFAAAVSIVLVALFSVFLFEDISIGFFFVAGATTVCLSIMLYNSVPE